MTSTKALRRKKDEREPEVRHAAEPAVPARHAVPVGAVHDPAERDADRLAEAALAISSDYESGATTTSTAHIRRSSNDGADGLSVDREALEQAKGAGRDLDPSVRSKMEAGFGTDLSGVQIHTGAEADRISRSINAEAFTHDQDVFFAKGAYQPGTAHGDHVLAHELAHTLQGSSSEAAHRFPATWSTSPVPWKPLTGSVFRPGEGLSGGVYILSSKQKDPQVGKVVAKPVFGESGLGLRESGEQLAFSDKALGALFGMRSPVSKIVKAGSTEFGHLVDVCTPYQPGKPKDDDSGDWQPLSKAQSFVVMSEVPNATSISGLADKAVNDQRASADLFRTVFADSFLADLGRLCIGDLVLNNPDRLVLGAANLGNVMVSMQDGHGELHAIDTTAYLGKLITPSQMAKRGGEGSGGFEYLKKSMDQGPGHHFDAFFETLINRLKAGAPKDSDPNVRQTWALFEDTLNHNRASFLASFEYGWNDAMIQALALSSDKKKITKMTEDYEDQDVSGNALVSNLTYIGNRAQSMDHPEAVSESMGIMIEAWLPTVDRERMVPPASDELTAKRITRPDAKALRADVVSFTTLPDASNFAKVANKSGAALRDDGRRVLEAMPPAIGQARSEVDQLVSPTKSKRKGLFSGSKVELPRNRSMASHFIVDSTAVGAAAARAADSIAYMGKVSEELEAALGGTYEGSAANGIASLMDYVGNSVPAVAATAEHFKNQLPAAVNGLPNSTYGARQPLVDALQTTTTYVDKALVAANKVKQLDLKRAAAKIRASGRAR